jgi:hypothetical protein
MKTYTVTRRTPDIVRGMNVETLTLRSWDKASDASVDILRELGYVVLACCGFDGEPCECEKRP